MKAFQVKAALVALLGIFMLAGASISNAASGYGRGSQFNAPPQLTPQQQEQARQILDDNYTQTQGIRQLLNQKRAELDYELNSPNPDSVKIAALSQEIGALRSQMLEARSDARNELSRRGLPPDGFGPCWGGMPYWNQGYNGWHHGGRRHHSRGYGCGGGCW